jgi:hypothetical protein
MKTNFIRLLLLLSSCSAAILLIAGGGTANAQMVYKTNSLVTYGYSATNPFVPSDPTTAASDPLSTFSYYPTAFQTAVVGTAWNIASTNGVVGLTMNANPGNYFDGTALALNVNTKVNYNLVAPTTTSSAGATFSAPFTLYITHVDNAPFATPLLQYSTNIAITPPIIEITGPSGSASGQFTGALTLDINTIKLHFGIGTTNKITGMRLQVSPSLTVWAERGSANASVVNFDVTNQVVPEPSTYALLGFSALAFAYFARRRR